MHRRDFNLGILKMSAAALLAPRLFAQPLDGSAGSSTDNEPPAIAALYKNAIVIDSLCAPLTDMDAPPSADTLAGDPAIGHHRHQLHHLGPDLRRHGRQYRGR